MVGRRPPNPVEKANPARIPGPNSPLEKTPHKARVERDGAVSAVGTLIDMPAERRRTAGQDGVEDFLMPPGKPIPAAIKESVPCGANHIGHLERWPRHLLRARRDGARSEHRQGIQRAGGCAEMPL
jgi:hypothetical protein